MPKSNNNWPTQRFMVAPHQLGHPPSHWHKAPMGVVLAKVWLGWMRWTCVIDSIVLLSNAQVKQQLANPKIHGGTSPTWTPTIPLAQGTHGCCVGKGVAWLDEVDMCN